MVTGHRSPGPRGNAGDEAEPRSARYDLSLNLENAQLDADVAPGRPGVGADLVRRLGELADLLPLHARDVDDQRHNQAEDVAVGADADLRGHRGVAKRGVLAARDQAQ